MTRYGMVINLARCMGCRACMMACKVENNTPQEIFWMYVFRVPVGTYPNVSWVFMPRPCQHCRNPPCVQVCPTKARHKRVKDGVVLTDYNVCIGCRYCVAACPYGVNYFNEHDPEERQYFDWKGKAGKDLYGRGDVADHTGGAIPPYKNPDLERKYDGKLVAGGGHYRGVIEKCTFCVHRLEKGMETACVANCPMVALTFGDLDNPGSRVSKLVANRRALQLKPEYGTDPQVYYLRERESSEDEILNPDSPRLEVVR